MPNTDKKLSGKPHLVEFNIGTIDFDYGKDILQELNVYITPITKKTKSVKYSMYIPDFLYNKCMTNPILEERPKTKFIEADTLSTLHSKINDYVNMAFRIKQLEKSTIESKKIICINFNSLEQTTRDDYNHGYTGQKITINFNYYIAYKTKNNELFTYKKYKTGLGTTEKGISGIIDSSLLGKHNWLHTNPKLIVDWTQEREDFLIKLENDFRELSEKLNYFLKDLNEEKLQKLVESKNTKLIQ